MGPLFLAFVVLPLADLWLLIRIGGVIGGFNALTYTLAMGLLGSTLVRTQGRKVLDEWRQAQAAGRIPEEGVVGGLLVLAGGLLLISPGVVTDVLGLCCLFPPTRRAIARGLAASFARKIAEGRARVQMQDFGFGFPPRPPTSTLRSRAEEPRASTGYGPSASPSPRDPRSRQMPRQEDVIDTEGEEL